MRRLTRGRGGTLFLPAALAAILGACALHKQTSTGDGGAVSSSQIIYADEIERSRAANAYDAVDKLRHNFLSDRGKTSILDTSSPTVPNVYLDGMPFGPLVSLRNIPAHQIASIRLYRAWEAQTKFGMDNPAGVIEVLTKR